MQKEYRYNTIFRILLSLGLIIALFGGIELGQSYGLIVSFILIACIAYFGLLILTSKIIITDEYIVQDIGKLGKRIERNWDKVYRVSRIPFSFLWMYRIHCKDKPMLMFSNTVANYKDLLREIIQRSPNATIDDSVTKQLEKNKE